MSLRTDSASGTSGPSTESPALALGDRFYPLYDRLFSEDSRFVVDVERKLAQARMSDTVEHYLSRALGIGVIAGFCLWIVGSVLGYALFATGSTRIEYIVGIPVPSRALLEIIETVRIPALVGGTGLACGSVGFVIGFGALVAVPYSRASARKRQINMLLTDSVSFMYALSVGGLNQLEIIEAMAQADDTYGEVAKEFQSIVEETEYFDADYRAAIRRQALETPSDELSQFLTDMLSIVNSGGDVQSFLEDKKETHMRTAKREQQLTLETLELFGEMYMTLSLFPLLLIIIMVIVQLIPDANVSDRMLYTTVYGLIPLTGTGFLVLVSTVTHDEPSNGYLSLDGDDQRVRSARERTLRDLGLVERFTGERSVFDRIKHREEVHKTTSILTKPHLFFRDNPLYTLALTVPTTLVIVAAAVWTGTVPASRAELLENAVWGTFVYVYLPLYVIAIPLAIFREWNVRHRTAVVTTLSGDLRKLSSANDTGLTLLESLQAVADTTSGKLASEFETMHTKVNYGTSLKEAFVEFANAYHVPRLARTTRLITEAQEASNRISAVLRTAARASEIHDELERERKSRTRMQIAILKTQFIETMAGLETGGNNGNADLAEADLSENIRIELLSVLFFHAVTLQAISSGFICGYIRDADLLSGLKYVIVISTIALVSWVPVA